jgi:methylated-DNA-protein-cysteine methyltransferase-like protein
VTSYGAIARYLGTARSARAVGYALNATMGRSDIPAHRVVNSQGMLSGRHHFPSPTAMEEALASEGIDVKENRVVHFEKYFWDPSKELEL